jgi:hypothetical protein
LVEDPERESYEPEVFLDAISSAHDALLPFWPKASVASITVVSGTKTYDLPTDIFEVEAVVDSVTGEVLPQASIFSGAFLGQNVSAPNDWALYPDGQVTFFKAPSNDLDLYYSAIWTKPTESALDDDPLEPPDFLTTAMTYYGASYLITPAAVSITEIRQFNQKVDSGNPEHNPMKKASDWLMDRFLHEMKRLPAYRKSQR